MTGAKLTPLCNMLRTSNSFARHWCCDWQRGTSDSHMQIKPLVCFIGCPCSHWLFCFSKIPATELSEAQNYTYWDANFCLKTHEFYDARVHPMHVFSNRQVSKFSRYGGSKIFDSTSPRISSHMCELLSICVDQSWFEWCVICSEEDVSSSGWGAGSLDPTWKITSSIGFHRNLDPLENVGRDCPTPPPPPPPLHVVFPEKKPLDLSVK